MKTTMVFAVSLLLASTCLAQAATDLERFGVLASLPDGWHTDENHTPSLPEFGVYQAKSDDGGFFWVMVNADSSGTATETVPHPDELPDGMSIRSIPATERPDGYLQGHMLDRDGVANSYFFVGDDGERRYRFRIGYELKFEPAGGEADVLSGILKSISFSKKR